MRERSEVRAGVFVILALAILGAGTLWIVGFSPMRGRQVDYEVEMKSSGGVRRGDRIRVAGIEVGRVKSIDLKTGEEWPVLLRVSVNERVKLTRGSTARITSDGLLGAPYLEIEAGPHDAEPLAPGSRIPGGERGSVTQTFEELGEATERLPELLDQVGEVVAKINLRIEPLLESFQAVLSEDNVEALSGALGGLRPTIEELGPQLNSLVARLESLASELEEGVGGVPELTSELSGLVSDLRLAVGADGERLAGVLDAARTTLSSAEGTLSTLGDSSPELDALVRDLREAAANLRSLSQTLKERPGMLLRFPRPQQRQRGKGRQP